MVSLFKKIFYFCTVKFQLRHEVAALMQLFLCSNFIVIDTERIMVCGSSNAHGSFAVENLTAPCTLILLMSNFNYYGRKTEKPVNCRG